MKRISYHTRVDQTPLVMAAEELLQRTIMERSQVIAARNEKAASEIILDIKGGIGEEGFRIEGNPGKPILITGNDERGLLYGIGKFLRHSRLENGSFYPGLWRGTSVPQKEIRGMYFATHFHNWYHEAPVEEVVRYVEELALWGCNALSVWFDMHHYQGINDPDAQKMLFRLRTVLSAAKRVGIRAGLTTLANEAYASSPMELRADWTAGHDGYFSPPGGHYRVEICPNKPGGLELILRWRAEVLDAFKDIQPAYIWIWPYDQGGCTCSSCTPWGTNGFLKTAQPAAQLVRSQFPEAKVILSTWYFDHFIEGEWAGLQAAFARNKPDWIDYLLIDDFGGFPQYPLDQGVPGGFPVVNFPEISMEGMNPWGAFGANPRPRHWQTQHQRTKDFIAGGFPYSEGIFEDLNKVLLLQWGWDTTRDAEDIIREYATSYFSAEVAEDASSMMFMMEENEGMNVEWLEGEPVYHIPALPEAEACFDLANRIDQRLPEKIRKSWRWRIFWLRAALDAEFKRTHGLPGDLSKKYLSELVEIYHAHHAEEGLRVPLLNRE
jgi:hypothetical protein